MFQQLSSKKTVGVSLKIDPETDERIKAFETLSGVDRSTLFRSGVLAQLEFFEAQGYIRFPVRVVDSGYKEPIKILKEKDKETSD